MTDIELARQFNSNYWVIDIDALVEIIEIVRADERERCIEAILDVHTYKGTSADNVEQRNIVEYRNELIKAIKNEL